MKLFITRLSSNRTNCQLYTDRTIHFMDPPMSKGILKLCSSQNIGVHHDRGGLRKRRSATVLPLTCHKMFIRSRMPKVRKAGHQESTPLAGHQGSTPLGGHQGSTPLGSAPLPTLTQAHRVLPCRQQLPPPPPLNQPVRNPFCIASIDVQERSMPMP